MKVVLHGDSIRMGYAPRVARRLADCQIVSAETNGGDSRRNLADLDELVIAPAPEVVHLNCGLHDLKCDRQTGQYQVPLGEYRDNVRTLFQRLRAGLPRATLIWATTTPVIDDWHQRNKPFDRRHADVRAYNAAASAEAAAAGLRINDLYAVVASADPAACLSPDGVHFNPHGNDLLAAAVAAAVQQG